MSRRVRFAGVLAAPGVSLIPPSTALANAYDFPHNPVLGPLDLCLPALVLAIVVEGLVLLILVRIRRKPARRLRVACALMNSITVTTLAVTMQFGLAESLASLVAAEIIIWLFEAALLHLYRGTNLNWKEGLLFSLAANMASLLAGALLAWAM